MMISYCLSICGYIVFGIGAAHPQFDSVGRSLATTLGIAFGHYDYDSVVGQTFGLDRLYSNTFYWVLNVFMFLMLNILLAIILDAFEKNQDDRKQIDQPFIHLVTKKLIRPVYQCYEKIHCCRRCKRKNVDTSMEGGVTFEQISSEEASNQIEAKGLSVKFLESEYAENEFHAKRRQSIDKRGSFDSIVMENLLSDIKLSREKMSEEIGNIVGKDKIKEMEKTTKLFFAAYARDQRERTEYEKQLQQLQSHVTCSLRETNDKIAMTNDKIDMILKHLKMSHGKED